MSPQELNKSLQVLSVKTAKPNFIGNSFFFFHYGWVNSKRSHPTLPPPPGHLLGICHFVLEKLQILYPGTTPNDKQTTDELNMSKLIFSSRWNRFVSVFKNCCIDRTMHEVYVSFQIARKVFLVLSASTIHAQESVFSFKLFKRYIYCFSSKVRTDQDGGKQTAAKSYCGTWKWWSENHLYPFKV